MKPKYLLGILAMPFSMASAQVGDLGYSSQPSDNAPVDDLIFYGELMDMSFGYAVDDTVADFTVYDFEGNALTLSEELAGDRPVVIINGSVSCIRFRDTFDTSNNAQEFFPTRQFMQNHSDDINWIFVYGVEAHPTDGDFPSNCPPTINTDTAVVQPALYGERRWAAHNWEESEQHNFPLHVYVDNPDNGLYNNYFGRPFGMLALDCAGKVIFRGDWVTSFFLDASNVQAMENWVANFSCTEDGNGDGNGDGDGDGNGNGDGNGDGNFDGPSDVFSGGEVNSAVNVEQEVKAEFMIYPNPNSGRSFQISGMPDGTWIRVYSLTGQEVYAGAIRAGSIALPTDLGAGSYIVSVLNTSTMLMLR